MNIFLFDFRINNASLNYRKIYFQNKFLLYVNYKNCVTKKSVCIIDLQQRHFNLEINLPLKRKFG